MDKEKIPVIFRPKAVEAYQGEEPKLPPRLLLPLHPKRK